MEVKGIIFDWAGTVVDYGCMAPTKVFIEVFKDKGISITMEEARAPMGQAKKDHLRALMELESVRAQWQSAHKNFPSEDDLNELYEQLEPKLAAIVEQFSEVIPGVVEFCEEMKAQGLQLGSTTGYVMSMMEKIIPLAKAQGFCPDAIVTSSDKVGGRPYPWMMYENAERLGLFPPSSVVKIGDTVADIKEGLNAGAWTIGLTTCGNEVGLSMDEVRMIPPDDLKEKIRIATQKLESAGAHYVVESVAECRSVIADINRRILNGEKP
ncbi:MAG: phosphonoacetaldehyde hydrolase [Desulfuromonadales bacterium]